MTVCLIRLSPKAWMVALCFLDQPYLLRTKVILSCFAMAFTHFFEFKVTLLGHVFRTLE